MRRNFLAVLCYGSLLACAVPARGDVEPGVDEFVSDALTIAAVRAQTADEAAAFPPPKGSQRVLVKHVLKGLDSAQEYLIPAGKLQPGEQAIILFKFDGEARGHPGNNPDDLVYIWPLNTKGMVDSGNVPQNTDGGGWGMQRQDTVIPWEIIKEDVIESSPEEAGLYGQVIDALFFPEKFKALAAKDAKRATYARFVIAVHDFERDVAWLSKLLESPEKEIRAGAEARLKKLTGASVPAPKDDTPRSLAAWSEAWAKKSVPEKPPQWPPVPGGAKAPVEDFPAPLLKAVADCDADAFAKAFADWLDTGAMRDHGIYIAQTTLRSEAKGNKFFDPDSNHKGFPDLNIVDYFFTEGYMIPAPRLPTDLALNPKIPADQRLKYMAMVAQFLHKKQFAADIKKRTRFLKSQKPGSEAVKRAAFWEPPRDMVLLFGAFWQTPSEDGDDNPREVALQKLAANPGKDPAQMLMVQFLSPASNGGRASEAWDSAQAAVEKGNKKFIEALLQYVRTHHDTYADTGARILCGAHQPGVIAIMIDWLQSDDRTIRDIAAEDLWGFPNKETVPALIAAIGKEKGQPPIPAEVESDDPIVPKQDMLLALSVSADPRALDPLIDAVENEPMHGYRRGDLINGIARIGDKKALPALAKIIARYEWIADGPIPENRKEEAQENDIVLYSAVQAYAYIETHKDEYEPPDDFGNTSVEMPFLKETLPMVKKWEKEHAQ